MTYSDKMKSRALFVDRLSVAPLRYGAGVKGKINQSMSYGVPVVTTSIGAEGLEAVDGEDILIADYLAHVSQRGGTPSNA